MNVSDLIVKFIEKDLANTVSVNVIGDPMIDEYFYVDVNRISPEFPIPVYKSANPERPDDLVPGGAANVAYQFSHFNVKAQLVCLLDKQSQILFESKDINTNYCKILQNINLPLKKRVYAQNTPLVRWDFEKDNYGLDDIKKHLLELSIPDSDYNIFSDYSKGLFSYPWFRKFIKNSPYIIDPKNTFIDLWEDCTVLKPNAVESKNLSDRKNWQDQADFFMDALRCKGVVITQSGDGVVGKEDDYFEVRPEIGVQKPESVIGAGDCFMSFVAMALARGFDLKQASQIAFAAGSFYVQRKHNAPISPAELYQIAGVKHLHNPKVLIKRNFKLVFSNGCFDYGLTAAHVECLKFAKKQGDKLVVALNSDKSVQKLKGEGRPILPLEDRIKIISALEFVDYVVSFDDETPYELIKQIVPDYIVKGGDYKKENVVGNDLAKVILFKHMDCLSTTGKILKMKEYIDER